jgi:hypothetical protein
MTCIRNVLSPQVTDMEVKNSISRKPSLIGYQQSGDICNITDVLAKKPLTVRRPNRLITLFCIPTGDYFEHLLSLLITIITFVKLPTNTFAHHSFRSHLRTCICRNSFRPLNPLNKWYTFDPTFLKLPVYAYIGQSVVPKINVFVNTSSFFV